MKYLFFFFAICFMSSCVKHECAIKGQVVALDPALCPCCGGWIIVNGNDTSMYFYYDDDSILNERAQKGFPFDISFSEQEIEGPCESRVKEMTCFELIE